MGSFLSTEAEAGGASASFSSQEDIDNNKIFLIMNFGEFSVLTVLYAE